MKSRIASEAHRASRTAAIATRACNQYDSQRGRMAVRREYDRIAGSTTAPAAAGESRGKFVALFGVALLALASVTVASSAGPARTRPAIKSTAIRQRRHRIPLRRPRAPQRPVAGAPDDVSGCAEIEAVFVLFARRLRGGGEGARRRVLQRATAIIGVCAGRVAAVEIRRRSRRDRGITASSRRRRVVVAL